MFPWAHSLAPKWHLDRFSRFSVHHSKDSSVFQWGRQKPQKLPLPLGRSGSSFNVRFLVPTRVSLPSIMWIGSAVFSGLANVTNKLADTQTDHITPFVAVAVVRILCNACDAV